MTQDETARALGGETRGAALQAVPIRSGAALVMLRSHELGGNETSSRANRPRESAGLPWATGATALRRQGRSAGRSTSGCIHSGSRRPSRQATAPHESGRERGGRYQDPTFDRPAHSGRDAQSGLQALRCAPTSGEVLNITVCAARHGYTLAETAEAGGSANSCGVEHAQDTSSPPCHRGHRDLNRRSRRESRRHCAADFKGQLGLGDNQKRNIPTQIPNIKAKAVSCGDIIQ